MTDKLFGIHAETLRLRAQRSQILAANMANADTPGYKARDLDIETGFSRILNQQAANLEKTHPRHFSGDAENGMTKSFKYRVSSQPSLDGNTVDMEQERSEFMQNALMYQASLRFLNGRISGLLTAIRGD